MTFPHHDKLWTEVADFTLAQVCDGDTIICPDEFHWVLDSIYRYQNTSLLPEQDYDLGIVHKGRLAEFNLPVLQRMCGSMAPIFANEVFVVLSGAPNVPRLGSGNQHVAALLDGVAKQREQAKNRPQPSPKPGPAEPVLPDPGRLKKCSAMTDDEFVEAMDDFFRAGGYRYETLRDQTYYRQIDRAIDRYLGDAAGKKVLDLCCGNNRLGDLITGVTDIVGIDISNVAIEQARDRSAPRFRFQRGDAHNIECADETFDIVIFCDSTEHVRHIETVLSEMARVLKKGGSAFLTAANVNSVNQIMSRKLGYGGFVTNFQHIREFSYSELTDMLADVGLEVERSDGLFLYPYWGIPGVDDTVRSLTDDDPEVVELMRVLGERVGPEHAYAFTVLAAKK
ncbi:MAG: class I SAM-dependent methyltransferase [Alphaproteobacteria bacterium]|nr:class I SAM-dependent methyltransferase [Alphaproteobacteria bacterium]